MFLNGPACHSFEVDQIPVYVFEWTIHLHLSYQMPFVPLSLLIHLVGIIMYVYNHNIQYFGSSI